MRWLYWLAASRLWFALINTVFAAQIPGLRAAWGMSASQAGLVQSAWHGGYLLSLVLASTLAGRYGARTTLIGMGYAACVSSLLFALCADSFASALALYGLAGLCAGGSYLPGLMLIDEQFPAVRRGRAMGYYIAAASLGYAVGLVGSNALASVGGPQAGFLLATGGTVLGQLIALAALRDTPNLVHRSHRSLRAWCGSLRWLWRNRAARLLILAYGFHAWELLGMWAWLPAFLSHALRQASSSAWLISGALLAALTHVSSMAGSMAGGALSDRWGRARVMLLMSATSLLCALLFGWLLAAPLWLLATVALLFNCAAIGDSAIYSAALGEIVPQQHLATAYSLRSILGYGMGALSPWLMGIVLDLASPVAGATSDFAWGLAWSALGAVALAGPCIAYRLERV